MRDDGGFLTTMHEGDTIAVLLRLRESGDMGLALKDLTDVIGNFSTKRNRIDAMEEEGLVDVTVDYHPRKLTNIRLTSKGAVAAASLAAVNLFVSPEIPDVKDKAICRKYADPILRILRPSGSLTQADVIRVLPNYRTVVKTMAALRDEGLITITPATSGYRTNTIALTTLGARVAEVLESIHQLIKKND